MEEAAEEAKCFLCRRRWSYWHRYGRQPRRFWRRMWRGIRVVVHLSRFDMWLGISCFSDECWLVILSGVWEACPSWPHVVLDSSAVVKYKGTAIVVCCLPWSIPKPGVQDLEWLLGTSHPKTPLLFIWTIQGQSPRPKSGGDEAMWWVRQLTPIPFTQPPLPVQGARCLILIMPRPHILGYTTMLLVAAVTMASLVYASETVHDAGQSTTHLTSASNQISYVPSRSSAGDLSFGLDFFGSG